MVCDIKEKVETWFEKQFDSEFYLYRGYNVVNDIVVISYDKYLFGDVEHSGTEEVSIDELGL